ncbi:MAG: RNA-binding protein [Chitinophagales bacterium]|nr:RNA-binding protein [Bacteroidota bacterium]
MEEKKVSPKTISTTLYVSNLSPSVDAWTLENLFAKYGEVMSCKIFTHPRSEEIAYAFVGLDSAYDASFAIKDLNGYRLAGRNIKVNYAKPKSKK